MRAFRTAVAGLTATAGRHTHRKRRAETNTASWGCARGTLGTLALLVGTLVLLTAPTNASSPRAVDGLARSLFCSVSSVAPTTAGCLAEWQACKDSPASCCEGTYCYRENQWYSQCRTTGVSSHPCKRMI
jgi:hypothetical protein